MKHIIIALCSILIFSSNLFSQNDLEKAVREIDKNNTTLLALRKSIDAEKIENKTGNYLQNPDFEFNYLWGNNQLIGNRTGINLKQSFDFPTSYGYRKEISNIKNEQIELEYQKQQKSIILQARLLCIDLIHSNAMKLELTKRLAQAQSIANSYQQKFDIGEASILEYNKAQFHLLNLRNDVYIIDIEQTELLSNLSVLNGGLSIEIKDNSFQMLDIPADFELWYAQAENRNPLLNWLKQEVELMQNQEKLSKAMSLPKFHAGYISESLISEQFKGVSVGLSLPLWENKNTVKYSKAKTLAIESIELDTKIQFYNNLKALHTKSIDLQKIAKDYRTNLQNFDNSELLEKALNQGEISLIDYMLELSIYFESASKLLDLDRDMHKAFAEMSRFM